MDALGAYGSESESESEREAGDRDAGDDDARTVFKRIISGLRSYRISINNHLFFHLSITVQKILC